MSESKASKYRILKEVDVSKIPGVELVTVEAKLPEATPKDPPKDWKPETQKVSFQVLVPEVSNAGVVGFAKFYTDNKPAHENALDGPGFVAEAIRQAQVSGVKRLLDLSNYESIAGRALAAVSALRVVDQDEAAALSMVAWRKANPGKKPSEELIDKWFSEAS